MEEFEHPERPEYFNRYGFCFAYVDRAQCKNVTRYNIFPMRHYFHVYVTAQDLIQPVDRGRRAADDERYFYVLKTFRYRSLRRNLVARAAPDLHNNDPTTRHIIFNAHYISTPNQLIIIIYIYVYGAQKTHTRSTVKTSTKVQTRNDTLLYDNIVEAHREKLVLVFVLQ